MAEPEVLDLTQERPKEDGLITLQQTDHYGGQMRRPITSTQLEARRELMRGIIAVLLILLLVLIVLVTLYLAYSLSKGKPDDLSNVLQAVGTTVLTPIIGLIGAVTGFYYGGQRTDTQMPPPYARGRFALASERGEKEKITPEKTAERGSSSRENWLSGWYIALARNIV